jgi:hypothetical protein
MFDTYTLDKHGLAIPCPNPIKWAEWMEKHRMDSQLVESIAGIRVSTVFLGLNHRFGDGEPLLWETMVFNDDEVKTETFEALDGRKMKYTSTPDLGQWRFSSAAEANNFHKHRVDGMKAALAASVLKGEHHES